MSFRWSPIKPLDQNIKYLDLSYMQPLYESWHASLEQLKKNGKTNLQQFNDRLIRRFSIETGILERIYDLDRGTTEILVASGFNY